MPFSGKSPSLKPAPFSSANTCQGQPESFCLLSTLVTAFSFLVWICGLALATLSSQNELKATFSTSLNRQTPLSKQLVQCFYPTPLLFPSLSSPHCGLLCHHHRARSGKSWHCKGIYGFTCREREGIMKNRNNLGERLLES